MNFLALALPRPSPLIFLVCATLLSSHPVLAQFSQQGPKLVGTGAVGNASQGTSVSISADGNTAIVGGDNDNSSAGAAWVWTRSGGVWTQQGTKLVGSGAVGNALQGCSVSISADGNTAIIGGTFDNNYAGAAWVWTRSGGIWTQQGTKLVGSDAVGNANQGCSVSLSADGNTAIIGGPSDNYLGGNSSVGAAWVFTRSGGVWSQQGTKLVGSGAVGNAGGNAGQGSSVSISGDGNTAIIGGTFDNNSAGAVWVWTRSGGVWSQQGTKLVGSCGLGNSVSLSAGGNTAIVGGFNDSSSWVWTRSGGIWFQQAKLVGSGAVGNLSSVSVSLSADGNTAIAGGPFDNSGGAACWVWTRSEGVWTQWGTKLVGSGIVGNAAQGNSVSLSGDGSTAIVGGTDDSGAGAAWVFAASAPAIVYTPYPQWGFNAVPPVPGVPQFFGKTGDSLTVKYGCALCSSASMLTSFGIPITPAALDARLIQAKAYSDEDDLYFDGISSSVADLAQISLAFSGSSSLSPNDFLNDHISSRGERVILKLNESVNSVYVGTHFILVTGRNGNDWNVFDPGWNPQSVDPIANFSSLQGHQDGFTHNGKLYTFTVAGYRTFKSGSIGSFVVRAHSPVELMVTDPNGHRVGFDPISGTNVFEITDAGYSQDAPLADAEGIEPPLGDPSGIKTIYIPSPVGGTYQVLTTGTGSGTYTLDTQTAGLVANGQSTTFSGTANLGLQFTNNLVVVLPPTIQTVLQTLGAIQFSWTATTGQVYQVQYKNSLADTNWNNLGDSFTATNPIVTSSDVMGQTSQKFYRVAFMP